MLGLLRGLVAAGGRRLRLNHDDPAADVEDDARRGGVALGGLGEVIGGRVPGGNCIKIDLPG